MFELVSGRSEREKFKLNFAKVGLLSAFGCFHSASSPRKSLLIASAMCLLTSLRPCVKKTAYSYWLIGDSRDKIAIASIRPSALFTTRSRRRDCHTSLPRTILRFLSSYPCTTADTATGSAKSACYSNESLGNFLQINRPTDRNANTAAVELCNRMVILRLFIRQIDGSGVRCYSPGVLPLLMHGTRNNKVTCSRERWIVACDYICSARSRANREGEGRARPWNENRITIAAEMLR